MASSEQKVTRSHSLSENSCSSYTFVKQIDGLTIRADDNGTDHADMEVLFNFSRSIVANFPLSNQHHVSGLIISAAFQEAIMAAISLMKPNLRPSFLIKKFTLHFDRMIYPDHRCWASLKISNQGSMKTENETGYYMGSVQFYAHAEDRSDMRGPLQTAHGTVHFITLQKSVLKRLKSKL